MRRTALTLTFGLAAVLLASCGGLKEEKLPETNATLEGTIKYGGEVVAHAQVIVTNGKLSAFGTVGDDGKYRVPNAPIGLMKVAVNTKAAMGEYQSKMMASSYKGPDGKSAGKVTAKFVDLPEKYYSPDSSGLKTEIKEGINTYNIEIPK